MESKLARDERTSFADRLRSATLAAGQPIGASAFARAYNLRADGAAVTTHGVRKWLRGEAIPTQEKILILAKWLNVHASWLRFGDAENGIYALPGIGEEGLSTQNLTLIHDIMSLSASAQEIVRDLTNSLMRIIGSGSEGQHPRKQSRRR
jgi:transcriptional regulator with XRE-family HTH domain